LKRIKRSFIGKAFFSLIILYFVVFLFLFVFQGFVFRAYYTRRTILNIKNETQAFIDKDHYESPEIEGLLFSRDTQTITSLISVADLQDNVNILDLVRITVTLDNVDYTLLAPKLEGTEYEIGHNVSSTAYLYDTTTYIPTYLSINNETIIRSNQSSNNPVFDDIFDVNDSSSVIQINGSITQLSYNTGTSVNSVVSNEILNLASKNYITNVTNNLGSYYYTESSSNISSNLVFYTFVEINNEEFLLTSVYSTAHVDDIVSAAGQANVYMFLIVLLILMIASFVYSREFSRPLIFINKKTKDLSKLNFNEPLIKIESSDEFSELAKNINVLSINLQTTIYQLNEQNKQLSDSLAKENTLEERRRDFVQGMSHELKTPLAVIQASAEALENNIFDTKEEQKNALSLIQKEVLKTNNMIKSMMTVYKVDSPDFKKEWKNENIKDIILSLDRTLSLLYTNSNIVVEMHLNDTILYCDRDRIETVITNLFTNAIKYTPNRGKIKITLLDNPKEITFKIQNFGVSIPAEEQKNIFEPFYRVDKARGRSEGSTGLGLYIVNQSLQQYNTKCEVESDSNSVTFSFIIKKVINP